MKYILTIAFFFIVSVSVAQSKKYYRISYRVTTNCETMDCWQIADFEPTITQIRASVSKWVSPYKIQRFEIYGCQKISYSEYKKGLKPIKYTCLNPNNYPCASQRFRVGISPNIEGIIPKDTTIKISMP